MHTNKQTHRFSLPHYVTEAIDRLNAEGYEAYLVGGAVRDLLMGKNPADYDLTTSALPHEMHEVFRDLRTIDTGIAHGTLTVLIDGNPLQITTYRIDGAYTDSRHPSEVRFTRSLKEDVARRDFTIGALAYHPKEGLYDFFAGERDLKDGVLRTVGRSEQRFQEDALRILRGLRFASVLGFTLEEETARAIHTLKDRLVHISPERIREEFVKLLCGTHAHTVLQTYQDVIAVFLPEIIPMIGFSQESPHHDYDVWEHTRRALANTPCDAHLRLAVFFHDIGKPACFFRDEAGVGHFHGHEKESAQIADEVMRRLRFDTETRERVLRLIAHHSISPAPQTRQFRRFRSRFGDEFLVDWLAVIRADRMGKKRTLSQKAEEELILAQKAADALLAKEERITLATLALNGSDLLEKGFAEGKAIGDALAKALDGVITGRVPNEKRALLQFLQEEKDAPIECERKFLIRYPDTALLTSLGAEKSEITQTYLTSPSGVTSRVRRRAYADRTVYTHTEKKRINALSAVEQERVIDEKEYEHLLQGADKTTSPIYKQRYVLPTDTHALEIDIYPFWSRQAVLEIELQSEDEPVFIPDFLTVLREVTTDVAYKNARLARRIPKEDAEL